MESGDSPAAGSHKEADADTNKHSCERTMALHDQTWRIALWPSQERTPYFNKAIIKNHKEESWFSSFFHVCPFTPLFFVCLSLICFFCSFWVSLTCNNVVCLCVADQVWIRTVAWQLNVSLCDRQTFSLWHAHILLQSFILLSLLPSSSVSPPPKPLG